MLSKIKLLRKDSKVLLYLHNTSWLFLEKLVRMALSLIIGIWLARYLGPENFGTLSYILSFVGLFSALTSLGLDSVVVQKLVKEPEQTNKFIGTGSLLKFFGSVSSVVAICVFSYFSNNSTYINELILILSISHFFMVANIFDFYFQSKVLSRYTVYSSLISLSVSVFLKVMFILNDCDLVYIVIAVVSESLILAICQIYFFKKVANVSLKIDYPIAINLMKNAWPFMLSGVLISIYLKIDQVMIKDMLGEESVGQYAIAARLSEIWYFIPIVIITSFFPAIVEAKKTGEENYYNRLQQLYTALTWLSIIIAIFISFSADWLVNLLYGPNYNLSGGVLIIHIWTSLFIFFNIANSKWLLIEGLNKYRLIIDVFSTFTNVILNLTLIPIYGVEGAALATLLSYSSSILILYTIVPSLRISLKMFIFSFNPYCFVDHWKGRVQ